jgi:type III secretory pathway component EscS
LKKKRPFLLKLIILSLAIIAVMGWLRVYQSIYQWETLLRFGVQPGPWYSLISGAVIGVVSTIAALSTWLRFAWSQKYVQISIVILAAGWWLDYLIFSKSSIAFYNLPFRMVATSIYLGFVFGYFYLTKKQVAKRMMNEEQQ